MSIESKAIKNALRPVRAELDRQRERVVALKRERDEARAEVERLKRAVNECDCDGCAWHSAPPATDEDKLRAESWLRAGADDPAGMLAVSSDTEMRALQVRAEKAEAQVRRLAEALVAVRDHGPATAPCWCWFDDSLEADLHAHEHARQCVAARAALAAGDGG